MTISTPDEMKESSMSIGEDLPRLSSTKSYIESVSRVFSTGSKYDVIVSMAGEKLDHGTFTWSDGGIYEGEFYRDKRHGFGIQVSIQF